jgi:ketosteroid isomerase-like protein
LKRLFLLGLSALLITVLLAPACKKPINEEDRVKAVINETAELARAKDIKGILDHVSKDYKDPDGNDRNALKGVLFVYFQGYEKVGIFVRDIQVTVDGDEAEAQVKTILTGGEDPDTIGDVVPASAGGYLLNIKFVNEDGDWKVVRATWTDIGFTKAL